MKLIQACKKELEKHWEVQLVQVYRECNRAADLFAFAALYHDGGVMYLDVPPLELYPCLLEDNSGAKRPRRVLA